MIYLKKYLLLFLLLIFPIRVYAYSSVVIDVDSGRILYENNSHSKELIASTTKIMTCIIVLENSDIEKEITVGDEILEMVGTNIYISVGEKLKIIDLLYGLMLRSGNDAAETLAYNTLGYDEFINKMNLKAKEIGMKNTTFSNPHGLDDNTMNYSTAYDMALLSKYAYKNKVYRKIISTKKYVTKSNLKSYVWYNRMSLLNKYKNCIGGKNGYTPKAGKSLVSYASNKNITLSVITLDDSDIYNNHINIYDKYFSLYKKYLIVDKNNFYMSDNYVNKKYYLKKSFSYILKEEEVDKISTLIEIFPTTKDYLSGKVIVNLNNEKIGEINIYEKNNKKKKDISIFQKIKALFIR